MSIVSNPDVRFFRLSAARLLTSVLQPIKNGDKHVQKKVKKKQTNPTMAPAKEYTLDEISKHTSAEDCWLIIGNQSNGTFVVVVVVIAHVERLLTHHHCWFSFFVCFSFFQKKKGGPKVYNVTKYLDDHPGGAEVMLDVAGQDADEFFEDIGHSREAREELKKYYIGDFKLDEAALAAMKAAAEKKAAQSGQTNLMVIAVVLVAIAAGVYTQLK